MNVHARTSANVASRAPSRLWRNGCAVALCAAGIGWSSADIAAATIQVNTFDDIVANDGACSLREAIKAVNAQAASGGRAGECPAGDGSADTIVLAAGSYFLSIVGSDESNNATGDLDLRKNMTLQGAGIDVTTIYAFLLAAAEEPDRVMHVIGPSVQVHLRDLTIAGGHAPDGVASATSDFGGAGGDGGGISASNSTLTISDSLFTYDHGGNTGNDGSILLTGVGSGGGGGGAISLKSNSTLTLSRTTLTHNSSGTVSTTRVFSNNTVPQFFGGALSVSNNSSASVAQANFDANTSDNQHGGAIGVTTGGSLVLTRSSVTRSVGLSALLADHAMSLQLSNDTFAANADGGGAIVLEQTTASMDFVTVSGNSVGVQTAAATLNYRNSIIAKNTGQNCESFGSTSFVSLGHNVVGADCPSNAVGDVAGMDPQLGPLIDNGGIGATMMPKPTSPAINAASCAASSIAVDQRDHARPASVPRVPNVADGCDIGALELDDDIFWDVFGG